MTDKSKHHTKDPARRAADIADREAKLACREERDCSFFSTWLGIFEETLKEFCWPETVTE